MELLLVLQDAFSESILENTEYELRRDRLRRLSPLFDFLSANLAEALTVSAAARMLRMSASYFMRFFHAATGLTYSAYVRHLRVTRAYQLLIESKLSLAQIAAETGFSDQCHLSRHIRRRFGTSPNRIRSQQPALLSADPSPSWPSKGSQNLTRRKASGHVAANDDRSSGS